MNGKRNGSAARSVQAEELDPENVQDTIEGQEVFLRETRNQVECPQCHKVFLKQGLASHIRLAHGIMAGDGLEEEMRKAEPVSVHTLVLLQDRLNELKRLKDQQEFLNKEFKMTAKKDSVFLPFGGMTVEYYEESIQALSKGIGQKQKELFEQVRKLSKEYHEQVKAENPEKPVEKKSWWRGL